MLLLILKESSLNADNLKCNDDDFSLILSEVEINFTVSKLFSIACFTKDIM